MTNNKYETIVSEITNIFYQYSVFDVVSSIFISDIWLPNISSPIKHKFITYILLKSNINSYSNTNRINRYEEFKNFLDNLIKLVPSFYPIEDYVPETDWGHIKFHHYKKNYKIFYGSSISYVYDYLSLFQILYSQYDEYFVENLKRSPIKELDICLNLQHIIIENIINQPKNLNYLEIQPGHFEIPSEEFWLNCISFLKKFDLHVIAPKNFLLNYSVKLGEICYSVNKFFENIYSGNFINFFFINIENTFFVLHPREFIGVLLFEWSKLLCKDLKKIDQTRNFNTYLGINLFRYVNKRINNKYLFQAISAVNIEKEAPHDLIFPLAIQSRNTLFLFYVLSPICDESISRLELQKLNKKINEALDLFKKKPLKLNQHIQRNYIQFDTKNDQNELDVKILVVCPQTNLRQFTLPIPKNFKAKIVFLEQILYIFDEIDEIDKLEDFFKYLEDNEDLITNPIISLVDIFASFIDSYGVLVEGAIQPDYIALDPHWGSNFRYESLKKFWLIYPEVDFFDHPRSWKPVKVTNTRTRLEVKGYLGCALYFKIGLVDIFVTAPFSEMEYEQILISNLLIESIEYNLSNNNFIHKHKFFNNKILLEILFFPVSLVRGSNKFKHLNHLICINELWNTDSGRIDEIFYGVRIVFNDKSLIKKLSKVKNRSIEIDLTIEVLRKLDEICSDEIIYSLIDELKKSRDNLPQHVIYSFNKEVSFPEFNKPILPDYSVYKQVRKRIAELVKGLDVKNGSYGLIDAKNIINNIIKTVIKEIDNEVSKYCITKSIALLLSNIDAITFDYEITKTQIKKQLNTAVVDYEPAEVLKEKHDDYITNHKDYRYLIEKFIQISNFSGTQLKGTQLKYILALIHWLHNFQHASDSLHYNIFPTGLKITNDFLAEVQYPEDFKIKQDIFAEEQEKYNLGLIGEKSDKVTSPLPIDEYLDEIDVAFERDLGFSLKSLVNILNTLSLWPICNKNAKENSYYFSSKENVINVCTENSEFEDEKVTKVIEFCILKKDKLLKLTGIQKECEDLPIWENKKRAYKYILRPLIQIDNQIYWGPYSTHKAAEIWANTPLKGATPFDMNTINIRRVLEKYKKTIEKALVLKTFEIISRYTSLTEKELKLHKRFKNENYPTDLGDYDILAFLPDKNIILNIECKDILPFSCLKDAKTVRERIFGSDEKGCDKRSHIYHINKRQKYLLNNYKKILKDLNWPDQIGRTPVIVPLYVSRRIFWWMRYPPIVSEINFVRVDMLNSYINQMN